jgi:hypothetical protein
MAAGWKDALMADTGAPWNIPYVEPGDLVRDYPAADEAQALAIAAGLTAAPNPGIGSNSVQVIKTDTFTTTSATFTTITGMSATITPTTNTSKILIVVQLSYGMGQSASYGHFKLTGGNTATYVGAAAGNRIEAVFGGRSTPDERRSLMTGEIVYLDSPGVTSATTYNVQTRIGTGGAVFINRSTEDNDDADSTRGASSITLIEVKP